MPSTSKKSGVTRKPCALTGSPVPVRFTLAHSYPAKPAKERVSFFQSRKSAGDAALRSCPCWPGARFKTITSRCTSGNETGLRRKVLERLNVAVFAPIPNPRVRIATRVIPGFLANIRRPKRTSWRMECIYVFLLQSDCDAGFLGFFNDTAVKQADRAFGKM